jgi:hypothetical protein
LYCVATCRTAFAPRLQVRADWQWQDVHDARLSRCARPYQKFGAGGASVATPFPHLHRDWARPPPHRKLRSWRRSGACGTSPWEACAYQGGSHARTHTRTHSRTSERAHAHTSASLAVHDAAAASLG